MTVTYTEYRHDKDVFFRKHRNKRVYICFVLCYDIVTKEMENKTRRS